jgi:hypothetical protein
MGLKLAMGALPRAILTFQLRLRSGFLGVPIYCGAQVIQTRDGLCFALEALFAHWVIRKMGWKNLDGYGTLKSRVPGAIYFRHPASAQRSAISYGPSFVPETRDMIECHYTAEKPCEAPPVEFTDG